MEAQGEQGNRLQESEVTADFKTLREMELFKAELLATVSHELRSPLTSIKGYAATLLRHEKRISREERHEFLLAINEASDRLEVIVNRLLQVSQLETGAIEIERIPVDLAFLAREVISTVEDRLIELQSKPRLNATAGEGRSFTFTVQVEDEQGRPTSEEPIIQADRARIHEVFDNLLENATRYSPAGGAIEVLIRPVVSLTQREENGYHEREDTGEDVPLQLLLPQRMMEIAVRDRGIGIPAEQLRAIFERFHRVDMRLTREVNGLGLGLAICKHIIELHHGMIWAKSEPGKGSTFHIWLPVE